MRTFFTIISGLVETWDAFSIFFSTEVLPEEFKEISRGEFAVVLTMVSPVDNYLFGLVLMIFFMVFIFAVVFQALQLRVYSAREW